MNYKKLFAVAMTAGMISTTAVAPMFAYADPAGDEQLDTRFTTPVNTGKPSADDRAMLVVSGVEADAEVYGIQVVKARYNNYGLVEYLQTADSKAVWKIEDIENITDEDVTKLAKWAYTLDADKLVKFDYDETNKNFVTNKAEAGSYLVFVRKNYDDTAEAEHQSTEPTYVYNPMYLSNGYTDANDASTLGQIADAVIVNKNGEKVTIKVGGKGEVSAETDFGYQTVDKDGVEDDSIDIILTRATAYAKKTPINLEKNIVDASTKELKWEDIAVGDTVKMEILSLTPDYSAAFSQGATVKAQKDEDGNDLTAIYRLTDNQSVGLDAITEANIETVATWVLNGEGEREETPISHDYYSVHFFGDNDFYVDFDTDWLINNPASNIVVRYTTTVNKDCHMAIDRELNKARLDYYTLPNGELDVLYDVVEFYSFKLDNIIKMVEDGTLTVDADNNIQATGTIGGATFELTRKETADTKHDDGKTETKTKTYTMTTKDDGVVLFTGLDEGVYTLKETKAPENFLLTDKTWTVKIEATYDGFSDKDGKDYRFEKDDAVRDRAMSGYKVTVTDDATGEAVTSIYNVADDDTVAAWGIVNQRLSRLPSTGGEGTLMVTIGGITLAIGAGIILFGKKRKEDKEA